MITIRLLAAAALTAGAVLTPQTASGDSNADVLFAVLNAAGIPISSREEAVAAGELACNAATSGLARDIVAAKVSERTGLDAGQANTFVGLAQAVYCPWQPQVAG
jgi:hypothetical protein